MTQISGASVSYLLPLTRYMSLYINNVSYVSMILNYTNQLSMLMERGFKSNTN